jgi:hypothetical protein
MLGTKAAIRIQINHRWGTARDSLTIPFRPQIGHRRQYCNPRPQFTASARHDFFFFLLFTKILGKLNGEIP